MKQLHKQSPMPISQAPQPYSPKSLKHPRSLQKSLGYILKEQRFLFILVGVLIGSVFFLFQPSLSSPTADPRPRIFSENRESLVHRRDPNYENRLVNQNSFRYSNGVGRVPLGIGRKRKRIVVTGGAGFVGSHLVDKLIARGDDVIVVDNFFTGRKENVVHLFGNPRFELIRHDVVEPILLEVDQIYHLACPASPVRIARIFNTYGPRMCLDDGHVVSNFVSQVDGLVALMEGEHVGPFNLGNPGEFTMLELAEVVKETIDPSATIEFRPNTADDPHKRKPDISKAKELLNWEPKISLREGLPRMVDDFRNRILNEDEGKGNK
ncbi:hypothetical protein DH2020_025909 [Rehmannia glutinosa]|uniref:UDP-glucuronate decarboxylase n=1 Tax=Rehmannia glutinosa TaxID=99300 RepID=A0ABR0VYK2_REHGL